MRTYPIDPEFEPGITADAPHYHCGANEPAGMLVTLGRIRSVPEELWFEVRLEDVGATYLPVSLILGMLDDAQELHNE